MSDLFEIRNFITNSTVFNTQTVRKEVESKEPVKKRGKRNHGRKKKNEEGGGG
jgi:hypothetical protein